MKKRSNSGGAATAYQSVIDAALKEQFKPAKLLSLLAISKFKETGVDATPYVASLEESFERSLAAQGQQDSLKVEFRTGLAAIDDANLDLRINELDQAAVIEELAAAQAESTRTLIEEYANAAYADAVKNSEDRLFYARSERRAFNERLAFRWRKPLDLLAIQLALSLELGEVFGGWLGRVKRRSKDRIVVDVLVRLHARACLIATEVEVLLRNGLADGAMARWRTLHELTVTALFINQEGRNVAQRYADHLHIDSLRAADQYAVFAPKLGYDDLPEREVKAIKRAAVDLEARYGKSFLGEYGWAADALGNSSPRFAHIEAAVSLDRLRPYFKMASYSVHASSKGSMHRLGLLGDPAGLLLAGPSNAGLEEPGRLASLSLAQITICLLTLKPTADSTVWSMVLSRLTDDVEKQFIKAQRQLSREERTSVHEALKGSDISHSQKRRD